MTPRPIPTTLELAHEYSWSQDQESLSPQYSPVHDLDAKGVLMIGDLGLGSEAALVLDYRVDSLDPKITRL